MEIMIDQLQVVPKAQVLKNNTMERSLALALQKVSIPRSTSAHRALLINHFLEQVILQNIKTIAFRGIIKLNPHNENPLLKPYSTFITLNSIIRACAQLPPMKTILLFLSYCIALIFKHAILNSNNLFN
ncbi:hypothetical protein KVC99_05540 [Helicobacter pylori]|nr:hypothetical protein KVC99_05540 [Helicobacter pylori]